MNTTNYTSYEMVPWHHVEVDALKRSVNELARLLPTWNFRDCQYLFRNLIQSCQKTLLILHGSVEFVAPHKGDK